MVDRLQVEAQQCVELSSTNYPRAFFLKKEKRSRKVSGVGVISSSFSILKKKGVIRGSFYD